MRVTVVVAVLCAAALAQCAVPAEWSVVLATGTTCTQTNADASRFIKDAYAAEDGRLLGETGVTPSFTCTNNGRSVNVGNLLRNTNFKGFVWEEGCDEQSMEGGIMQCDRDIIELYTRSGYTQWNRLLRASVAYFDFGMDPREPINKDGSFERMREFPEDLRNIARLTTALNRVTNPVLVNAAVETQGWTGPRTITQVKRIDRSVAVREEVKRQCASGGRGEYVFATFLSTEVGGLEGNFGASSGGDEIAVQWTINVGPGTAGRLIMALSNTPEENEVLFVPKTTLKITNCARIRKFGRGQIEVEATEESAAVPPTQTQAQPQAPTVAVKLLADPDHWEEAGALKLPAIQPGGGGVTLPALKGVPAAPHVPCAQRAPDSPKIKAAAGFKDASGSWCYPDKTVVTLQPGMVGVRCQPGISAARCFIKEAGEWIFVNVRVRNVGTSVYNVSWDGRAMPFNAKCGDCQAA